MELAIVSGFFLGAVLLLAVLWRLLRAKPSGRLPPVKDGWIPWLGCAIEFGKEPLFFVQKAQKEVRGVANLHVSLDVMPWMYMPIANSGETGKAKITQYTVTANYGCMPEFLLRIC